MSAFLDKMAASSRARAQRARVEVSESALLTAARDLPQALTLELDTFDVIAEIKQRSPALGNLRGRTFDLKAQTQAYVRGGACAISVLTEPEAFHGSLADLREVAATRDCPVMRKDFLTDPYQVLEARVAGASGVLVIVTMLEDQALAELIDCAREHGLFVLLEAFDRHDLERIANLPLAGFKQPVLAGVNCRDLRSLDVDFARFAQLASALPAHLPVVAESGIGSPANIVTVASSGYRLALVGTALMQSDDTATRLAQFIETGRSQIATA